MKPLAHNLSVLTLLIVSGHAAADVIYSSFQNITIPTDFDGVYVDVDGLQAPSNAAFPGWDINPYMGGKYLANSAAFQPARVGTDGLDTVVKFSADTSISGSLNFASGTGGSIDHLGAQFTAGGGGTDEYLGFKLGSN